MVDCSHDNSHNNHGEQLGVLEDITRQILEGNQSIISLMLESNIEWGKQAVPSIRETLKYGVSITDACIDWRTTESAIKHLREKLKGRPRFLLSLLQSLLSARKQRGQAFNK